MGNFNKLENAIKMYNIQSAVNLIKKTDDIESANHKGQTALALAANRGQLDVVKLCLKKGATVDCRDQWDQTPLMRAAYNSHKDVMKILIEAGAAVNAANVNGKTAVLYAAENGSLETVKLLVKHGADIDAMDSADTSVLVYATFQEEANEDMVEFILKHCSNKMQRDWQGKNALDYAVENGYKKKIKLLKKAGLEKGSRKEIERIEQEKDIKMIRNIRCPSCGAPKQNEYKTPWIYCDFCAAFMDYDLRLAMSLSPLKELDKETKEARAENRLYSTYSIFDYLTIPEWNRICEAAPDLIKGVQKEKTYRKIYKIAAEKNIAFEYQAYYAAGTNDADLFAGVKVRETENRIAAHPAHFSPKINDETYRSALLEFTRGSSRLIISDSAVKKKYNEIILRQFDIGYNEYYLDSTSFFIYFDHYRAYLESWTHAIGEAGLFEQHPDGMTADQFLRLEQSVFLQQWIDQLEKGDVEKLAEKADSANNYKVIEPAELFHIHCGICGTELGIPAGAEKILCEICGTLNNAADRNVLCPSCSYSMLFPMDRDSIRCPACSTAVSRLG